MGMKLVYTLHSQGAIIQLHNASRPIPSFCETLKNGNGPGDEAMFKVLSPLCYTLYELLSILYHAQS